MKAQLFVIVFEENTIPSPIDKEELDWTFLKCFEYKSVAIKISSHKKQEELTKIKYNLFLTKTQNLATLVWKE